MREIEVKAKLRDEGAFLKAAEKLHIIFTEGFAQKDTTFRNDTPSDHPSWNIFRLRKQRGKILLTMKHRASNRSRDNYEYETIVEDASEVQKMLLRLGYTVDVHVNKIRRTAHYQDLELCLDTVEHLGLFIEVEKLVNEAADADAVQMELWKLLESLGVRPGDRVHKGYDSLMHEAAGTHEPW